MLKRHKKLCRGGTSLISVFFVTLFGVLSISFVAMSNTNVQMSRNHRDMSQAQLAAESGLEYAQCIFQRYMAVATGFYTPQITDLQAESVFDEFAAFLDSELSYQGAINYEAVSPVVNFTEGGYTGKEVTVPAVAIDSQVPANFTLHFRQFDDDPHTLEVISTGTKDGIIRKVRLTYRIEKDTFLLNYAMMSESRVIITGDTTVEGDILTMWDDAMTAPPITLAGESTVNGTLGVTIDEAEWDGNEVEGNSEGIIYDQPEIDMGYSDFDTTFYYEQTHAITPNFAIGQIAEYFPHAPDNYALPADASSSKVLRKVYEGNTFTNRQVSAGNDTLFRNCTFEGILYIGSTGGGDATNNVRFENCNFNGIIVTSVPEVFNEETWKKNVLYFTGNNTFNNVSQYPDTSILAPNFNVNIGDTQSADDAIDCTLTGLVVGGVVDVRGNVNVEGTILSIGDPGESYYANQIATNLGFSDENGESGTTNPGGTISVRPPEESMLPYGVRTDTLILPNPNSYNEL
ncbi:MAG: hypothetical protein JXD22_11220 [Sedimentisphaerales bacterium]|nr:hypothetical protein [Sedimentisphaerales bacterium]